MTPTGWCPDSVAAMQPVLDANPWGPLSGPLDVFRGAHLYDYQHANQRALIAVRPVDLQQGRRLDIVGLCSLGDRLTQAELDAAVLDLARGYDAQLLAMCTQRPHVVKSCERAGWMTTGAVMLKVVNHV